MRDSEKFLPKDKRSRIYKNYRQGAYVRSIASFIMWLFAFWAYTAGTIRYDHLIGVSCSVAFIILMNPPTLFYLKRITSQRALINLSFLINFLEIIGYTGVIYFLGGIEATYLTTIYAALITYVGAFYPRKVPFIVAGFAAFAFGTVEFLSVYQIIPTFRVDPWFNPTPLSIFIRVSVVIGLLMVVAYISSYTASRLKLSRRKLHYAHKKLEKAYHELKQTQANLVQSGKLASIGQLASGVAHELNQPLMVIRGNAQLLNRGLRQNKVSPEENRKLLKLIEKNTSRMMSIITHLSTFSRQSAGEFQIISVNQVLEDSLQMVGEQMKVHNIQIKKDLDKSLPKILGNANQLEQVFLNLITNSKDAISESGEDKKTSVIEITTHRPENKTTCVEIFVRDTGLGIAPENIDKVFDPFYTTKEVGQGTGLGLSISYGIIKDHQGKIDIIETGPEGTTFKIELPIDSSLSESIEGVS